MLSELLSIPVSRYRAKGWRVFVTRSIFAQHRSRPAINFTERIKVHKAVQCFRVSPIWQRRIYGDLTSRRSAVRARSVAQKDGPIDYKIRDAVSVDILTCDEILWQLNFSGLQESIASRISACTTDG